MLGAGDPNVGPITTNQQAANKWHFIYVAYKRTARQVVMYTAGASNQTKV